MDSVIEIKGLNLGYREHGVTTNILRDLDLDVRRGEFLAIVGASGVGKSTLLRVLMKLAVPSSGVVKIHPDRTSEREMAFVFQDPRLLPWRRLLANAGFGLEKMKLTRAQRRERGLEALRRVGLESLAGRYPHQVSGGQRQRVALARALAVNPSILLMDEPFSALDALTREALQDQLIQLWTAFKRTVLFVTHDIDEAVYLADRVIALGGKPGEIKASVPIDLPRPRSRSDHILRGFAEQVRTGLIAGAAATRDWVI